MFKGPQETVRDNKSSSYLVFELPGVNCNDIGKNKAKITDTIQNGTRNKINKQMKLRSLKN